MGIDACQIFFDDGETIFYAGSYLKGYVEYNFTSSMEIRGIKARFLGECQTSWYRRVKRGGKSRTVREHGNEIYFSKEHWLTQSPVEDERIEIPAGVHQFPFSYQLPADGLPASFEGEHGYIRYTVKFIVDRPWKFDHEYKCAITVLAPFDLNIDPTLLNPRNTILEKRFGCICISGPIVVNIRIPYGGYVPGQTIDIYGDYENTIGDAIDNLKLIFKKVVTYHSQVHRTQVKLEESIIEEYNHGPIERHSSGEFNYTLTVPALPPSRLPNCYLIELNYFLGATMETGAFRCNKSESIRLEIGTVPLSSAYSRTYSTPEVPIDGALTASAPVVPKDGLPTYSEVIENDSRAVVDPSAPPPTYHESVFVRTNSIHDNNDSEHLRFSDNLGGNFSPRYPVFNFAPSAPAPSS